MRKVCEALAQADIYLSQVNVSTDEEGAQLWKSITWVVPAGQFLGNVQGSRKRCPCGWRPLCLMFPLVSCFTPALCPKPGSTQAPAALLLQESPSFSTCLLPFPREAFLPPLAQATSALVLVPCPLQAPTDPAQSGFATGKSWHAQGLPALVLKRSV